MIDVVRVSNAFSALTLFLGHQEDWLQFASLPRLSWKRYH